MRQLCETLWVGHVGDARDSPSIYAAEVAALIDLAANEPPLNPPREFMYVRIPLIDGAGNPAWGLQLAADISARLLRENVPTLVYCSGGMSRSIAIASVALAIVRGILPEAALQQVSQLAKCDVSPGLWNELRATLNADQLQ